MKKLDKVSRLVVECQRCGPENSRLKNRLFNEVISMINGFIYKTIIKLAKKYNINLKDSIACIYNEALYQIWIAMGRFDHEKGVKFISYAVWYIQHAFLDYVAKESVVKPGNMPDENGKYRISYPSVVTLIEGADSGHQNNFTDHMSRKILKKYEYNIETILKDIMPTSGTHTKKRLTKKQKDVLFLMLEGYNYGISPMQMFRSTGKTYQANNFNFIEAKKKIRNYFEANNIII